MRWIVWNNRNKRLFIGTVMRIEKALINDRLRDLEAS